MKIKRYVAEEVREALRQVRHELGPDAVILSNRRTPDGVELVAAIDYDEDASGGWVSRDPPAPRLDESASSERRDAAGALVPEPPALDPSARPARVSPAGAHRERPRRSGAADAGNDRVERELRGLRDLLEQQLSGLAWGELGRSNPVRAHLTRRLLQIGLSKALADQLAELGPARVELAQAWTEVLRRLVAGIATVGEDPEATGGVIALVGPTGVGKTTTIAKLAARYRLRNGADSVALLTTDNFRVAAQEQLRTYGHLMEVPVAVCTQACEVSDALERYRRRSLILIDTAGLSHRDMRLAEQSALLAAGAVNDHRTFRRYLVLSATTAYHGLEEIVRAYHEASLDGCIVTKLDEATSLGGILSVLHQHRLPAVYASAGQRVPEDLALANPRQLVTSAVNLARQARRPADETLELAYGGLLANA